MNQGYSAYRTANVETADKGKLIIICYDVAIKHGKIALDEANPQQNLEEWVKHIYKMQDAVSELLGALNMDVGEISMNLYRLYEYMLHRLSDAVVNIEKTQIEEVLTMLTDLRSAWKIAIQNVKTGQSGTQPPASSQSFALNG